MRPDCGVLGKAGPRASLGQFDLLARIPALLVLPGPDPETPVFHRFSLTAPKGKPASAGTTSGAKP
ncbi:hypothetical protein RGR602_PB00472 (plasmid) [Rhizobium gallicum bv. gallicum R602sp]|uniref:Uncharacterized protein n=1 Tax=Rhizobium gallicum bv. gallicum R602sp TaxID=1041138 RepID=A0A0B4X7L3_9HYPH|nr:hypothetical protein RGR602_PB00455 [Rhizobium gallicum bv. gallicum R602sp]AJD44001.1 hypothetical protein RGR602_PB00472 [Rhizobium gallicum bv. gallicum R602sp]